jgi:hypothetical protein
MDIIITSDESSLEVITTDSYTREGTEDLTISVYNKICNDSSHISLNDDEVRELRDYLTEWLQD